MRASTISPSMIGTAGLDFSGTGFLPERAATNGASASEMSRRRDS